MRENQSVGFQNASDTNQSVQLQSIVKNLKFQTEKEEASNYLLGENKGADLLAVTVQLICVFVKMLHAKRRFSHHAAHFLTKRDFKKFKNDLSK